LGRAEPPINLFVRALNFKTYLVVLLVGLALVHAKGAPGTISLSVNPSGCIAIGEVVTVTARISGYTDTTEIDGFNFEVSYDSTVLSFVANSFNLGDASGPDQQWLSKSNQESVADGYDLMNFSDGSTAGTVSLSLVDLGFSSPEGGTIAGAGFLVSFKLTGIAGGTSSITAAAYPDGTVLFDTDLMAAGMPSFTGTSVTVDTTPPSITCPANIVANTDSGQCSKSNVTYTAMATDNCPGVTVSCSPASGSTFAKGATTVTCTATDAAGNSSTCSFTVTINDNEKPSATCPANIVANTDSGQCSKSNVTYTVTAMDNCPGVTASCSPASGSTFAKGATTVTCTATDVAGNSSTCSFTVTINDNEKPSITCPANIVANTDSGQCSKSNVTYTATATDNCPGVTVSCSPASGSTFAKGATTVTCTATDVAGNSSTCSFTVTINDTQKPSISCPANIVANTDSGRCDAVVGYSIALGDNCPGVSAVCDPSTGTFPKGSTTVICTATDAAGNSSTCSFTVTINDSEQPSITCPANIVANTDSGQCSKSNVTYTATATDNCPGVTVSCSPASGSTFAKGMATVTCTATDAAGNTSTCSFTVTINDNEKPSIMCPADMTVVCTETNGAKVTFSPTATDNCDSPVTIACTPASGSVFPFGTSSVTCTATDAAGNSSSCSFSIQVDKPKMNIAWSGTDLVISWTGNGTLQQTNELIGDGPGTVWTDVSGAPTSPYTVPLTASKRFYRACGCQ
jgi:hypothetical protein